MLELWIVTFCISESELFFSLEMLNRYIKILED